MEKDITTLEFYLAGNFYEDNIGKVEVLLEPKIDEDGELIDPSITKTTFQVPSFIKHLTQSSRELIPVALTGVSQQEKLEMFVSTLPVLQIEMKWQQRLGRISYALKIFANQWKLLSWINFIIIIIANGLLIGFLEVQVIDDGKDELGNKKEIQVFKIKNEQI